jgi:hypothetical protein
MAPATSMAAFAQWVMHPDESLRAHLHTGYVHLAEALTASLMIPLR